MKCTWIIESECFESDTRPLIDAIKRLGHEVVEYNEPLYSDEIFNFDLTNKPIMAYCSLGLAKKIIRKCQMYPGVYYNIDAYNCSSYYPKLGRYILNSNYIMLPYGDLIRQKEFLYGTLAQDNTIFIRPNRGDKVFTGTVIYKEKFEEKVTHIGYGDVKSEELCVVSEPRNIIHEWRLVVVDGKVIASSLYKRNDLHVTSEGCPEKVINYAEEIAKQYSPDRIWIIDMCETSTGYYLLEIGCFSCAGLYDCNRDIVAKIVSDIVIEDYKDVY